MAAQGRGSTARRHKVSIPPKAFTYIQDVESIPIQAHFNELADNAIGAGAREIVFETPQQDVNGAPTTLVVKDRGHGMGRQVAEQYLQQAATTSGVVVVPRDERGGPLTFPDYVCTKLSRHGKGANSLFYFGPRVTIYSKAAGRDSTVKIGADFDEWQRRERLQAAGRSETLYEVEVEEEDWDPNDRSTGFTEIIVERLNARAAQQLASPNDCRTKALEMDQTYFFHIHGVDPFLWSTIPAALRGTTNDKRPAKLRGGLEIDFLGYRLTRVEGAGQQPTDGGAGAGVPPPAPAVPEAAPRGGAPAAGIKVRLPAQLQGAASGSNGGGGSDGGGAPPVPPGDPTIGDPPVRQFLRQAQACGAQPFWLAVRWTPHGMSPTDPQPTAAQIRAASGRGVAGDEPAGLLEKAHRDFLLCVLFYPFKDMKRTKPEIRLDSGEYQTFAFWGGRMMTTMAFPDIIKAAASDPTADGEFGKLNQEKLCCLLFVSPEVYTMNHKTHFQDEAMDDFMAMAGRTKDAAALLSDRRRGSLWVWDLQDRAWRDSEWAVKMLKQHHVRFWQKKDEVCTITTYDVEASANGAMIGIKLRMPLCQDPIEQGQLVKRVGGARTEAEDDGPQAKVSPAARHRKGSKAEKEQMARALGRAGDHAVVQSFVQHGADGSCDIWAFVHPWRPPWLADQPYRSSAQGLRVHQIAPLANTKEEVAAATLEREQLWRNEWPRRLAFFARNGDTYDTDATKIPYFQKKGEYGPNQPFPDDIIVGFVSEGGRPVELARHHGFSSKNIRARLFKNSQEVHEFNQVAPYVQNKRARFSCLRRYIRTEGAYQLRIECEDPYSMPPDSVLFHTFKFEASRPERLLASFASKARSGKVAALHRVRLGETLPRVTLRVQGPGEKGMKLPLSGVDAAKAALCIRYLHLRGGGGGGEDGGGGEGDEPPEHDLLIGGFVGESAEGRIVDELAVASSGRGRGGGGGGTRWTTGRAPEPLFTLSEDEGEDAEQRLHIDNLVIPEQPLIAVPGSLECTGEAEAAVELSLTVPMSGKTLEAEAPLHINLRAARPSRVIISGLDSGPQTIKIVPGEAIKHFQAKLVDKSNNPVLDTTPAEITFDPPDAAEEPLPTGRGKGAMGGESRALVFEKGDLSVQGGRYRVTAGPGQTFAMTLGVKSSDAGAGGSGGHKGRAGARGGGPVQPVTVQFRVQQLHLALNHEALPQSNSGRQVDQDVHAYVLNTWEHLKHEATYSAEAVPRNLALAFEAREDIVRGSVLTCFVRPNGDVLRVRPTSQMADIVNSYVSCPRFQNDVYEAAFAIPREVKSLSNLEVQICDEQDQHEPDFATRVHILANGAPAKPSRIDINGGAVHISSLALDPAWFTPANNYSVCFDVRDGRHDSYSYGCFWVRHRRAPVCLGLLPAGDLYKGALVEVTSGGGAAAGGAAAAAAGPAAASETVELQSQQLSSGSRAGQAWAPWVLADGSTRLYLHPRSTAPLASSPLPLRHGDAAVVHFVALDQAGFPIALSERQQATLRQLRRIPVRRPAPAGGEGGGVTTSPPGLGAPAAGGVLSPTDTRRATRSAAAAAADPAATPGAPEADSLLSPGGTAATGGTAAAGAGGGGMEGTSRESFYDDDDGLRIIPLEWQFCAPSDDSAAAAAAAAARPPPLIAGHLQGAFVNSVAIRAEGGTGRVDCQLYVPLPFEPGEEADAAAGPAGLTLGPNVRPDVRICEVRLPLLVLPGRIGSDALAVARATDDAGRDVAVELAKYKLDAATLEPELVIKPEPAAAGEAAAAAAGGGGGPEQQAREQQTPPAPLQRRGRQQRQQQQQEEEENDDGVVDLTLDSDDDLRDEEMAGDGDAAKRLRLWTATARECGGLTLRVQLRDEFGNPVGPGIGGRLRLVRRRRPAPPGAAAPHEEVNEEIATGTVAGGAVKLTWQGLGWGPGWLGYHLLMVEVVPEAAAAATRRRKDAPRDLEQVDPIAVLVEVKLGNIPSALVALSPWARHAATAAVVSAPAPVALLDAPIARRVPVLRVGLQTRDGAPLPSAPFARLEVSLLRLTDAAGAGGPEGPAWEPLPDFGRTAAPLRSFGGGARGAAAAAGRGAAGGGDDGGGGLGDDPPPSYELGPGLLRLPERPGLYKWVLRYPAASPAVPDLEIGPIRAAAGGPCQLLAEPPVDAAMAFAARSELANAAFAGATVYLADRAGNPARFEAVPPGLVLREGMGWDDAEGPEEEGVDDGKRATEEEEQGGEVEEVEPEGAGAADGAAPARRPAGRERPAKRARTEAVLSQDSPPAAGAAAAAAPSDWRLQLLLCARGGGGDGEAAPEEQELASVPFDAAGRAEILGRPLASLPLRDAGVYAIVARATEAAPPEPSPSDATAADAPPPQPRRFEVVLARYQVASADNASLLRQLHDTRSALSAVRRNAAQAQRVAATKHAEAQRAAAEAAEAEREVAAAEERLAAALAALHAAHGAVENQPYQFVQGSTLLLTPRRLQHNAPLLPPGLFPHHAGGSVLGRIACLGAAERSDVARTLSFLASSALMRFACLNEAGIAAVRNAAPEAGRYNLTNRDMVQAFAHPESVDEHHPQRVLNPSPELVALCCGGALDLWGYHPEEGFVGQAVNLVRLTQQQLAVALEVPALLDRGRLRASFEPGQTIRMGLRGTLWHLLLRNFLVFETGAHLQRFRNALHQRRRTMPPWLKLIALDGESYNRSIGLEEGRSNYHGVMLPGVPAEEASIAPLDLRLRATHDLSSKAAHLQRECDARGADARLKRAEADAAAAAAREENEAAAREAEARDERELALQEAEGRLRAELQQLAVPVPPAEPDLDEPWGGDGGGAAAATPAPNEAAGPAASDGGRRSRLSSGRRGWLAP